MLKSTHEWLAEFEGKVTVYDPDGWDRKNLEASYAEKISREEFINRLSGSTISLTGITWPEVVNGSV